MIPYRAIGLMSGSSLDGLDMVCADFAFGDGAWRFDIIAADCVAYPEHRVRDLVQATALNAFDYLALHAAYGHDTGRLVAGFIAAHGLRDIAVIASHGHTVFHAPHLNMTAQLGCAAAIAAETGIDTVGELRAMDVALGGQGAPIVPIGEKLLWPQMDCFLNIGGIANLSLRDGNRIVAFDICPANRVLNMLAQLTGAEYDAGGATARGGVLCGELLRELNALDYYARPFPKSLDNGFGVDVVFPLVSSKHLAPQDALRTVTEHVAQQIANAFRQASAGHARMMVTGGGAFNTFLVERITALSNRVEAVVPDAATVNYKEALVMALLGVLRLRGDNTVLASVTGAARDSIGGALWRGAAAARNSL